MGRPLRYIPPYSLVEVTMRTAQGRLLLRPSSMLNQLIVGILARAAKDTKCRVCAVAVLANHYHLLLVAPDAAALARFMCFANSNIAREANRLHNWSGPFWGRRYRSIVISDEPEAQLARLAYLLRQGPKEGLVWSPLDWPGVHSAWNLMTGQPLRGLWIARSERYEAKRQGKSVENGDHVERLELHLAPLPCWASVDRHELRQRVREMVDEIEEETKLRHREAGTKPMGEEKILAQHPHDLPRTLKRSVAPMFHAATEGVYIALCDAYRAFVDGFRHAADVLRRGRVRPKFPPGSFPPGLPFVQHGTAAG
jgi:REP element-mobilizing transposase RayT